jgi:hypothetical protein
MALLIVANGLSCLLCIVYGVYVGGEGEAGAGRGAAGGGGGGGGAGGGGVIPCWRIVDREYRLASRVAVAGTKGASRLLADLYLDIKCYIVLLPVAG